ncbi:MAG: hypothetical protein JKY70_09180 [Mucilaginibacter sp.]|nr:hypothetical protein [Mucilaginibacter sp.]
MKTLRYFTSALLLSATLTSCGGSTKTGGNDKQDTTAKFDTTNTTANPADTSKTDSNKASTSADHTAVDTSDARPVH